jgi:hypothetical protein
MNSPGELRYVFEVGCRAGASPAIAMVGNRSGCPTVVYVR